MSDTSSSKGETSQGSYAFGGIEGPEKPTSFRFSSSSEDIFFRSSSLLLRSNSTRSSAVREHMGSVALRGLETAWGLVAPKLLATSGHSREFLEGGSL
jgi:hypothetical protein